MEITDVDTYALRVPLDRNVGDSRLEVSNVYWLVIEVETDAGHTGTGWMGSLGFGPGILKRFLDHYAAELPGRDPFATEAVREDLRTRSIYFGELGTSAWPRSAIDVALWDVKARASGQPLYRLLGGDSREVRAYASSMDIDSDPDGLRELHGSYADAGFTAFKTKVGDKPVAREVERVRTIREAVGPDADLFVDANQAWTVKRAIETVDAFSPYDIGWVEEPISEFDVDGHRRVADRIDPPLATGEMFYRTERFDRLLDDGGMEIAQPDLIRCGGITGQHAVARAAANHGVPLATHFYYAVSAHVVSAAPTGTIVEYIPEYDIAPLLETPPELVDGYVRLPDRPGHGYSIDDDARDEYEVTL